MRGDTGSVDDEDLQATQLLPARINVDAVELDALVSVMERCQLLPLGHAAVAVAATLAVLADQVVCVADHDAEKVRAGLLLRRWALDSRDTVLQLAAHVERHAGAQDDEAPGAQRLGWLADRYANQPAGARADGVDVIASDVLRT